MPALLVILLLAPLRAAAAVEIQSPDGAIRWVSGEASYTFLTGKGKTSTRLLPAPEKKGTWTRRLLFAEKGDFFCILDEKVEEVGLHLGDGRGPQTAKMAVSASVLRLVRKGGRSVWKKRLRDRHFGGTGTKEEIPIQIAGDGTLAVLLQDGGPYAKSRPVILVIGPRGRTKLELNYTVWSRVEELSLSQDGDRLAVRGIGRIPDKEDWGKAIGVYHLDENGGWVRPVAKADAASPSLRVHANGWVCCVREGPVFVAFDPSGRRERMETEEMKRRFGGPR